MEDPAHVFCVLGVRGQTRDRIRARHFAFPQLQAINNSGGEMIRALSSDAGGQVRTRCISFRIILHSPHEV